MKLTTPPYHIILTIIIATIVATACKPNAPWFDTPQAEWQDISDRGLPKLTSRVPVLEQRATPIGVESISVDKGAELAADRITESLIVNQARMAADYNDRCPKLINKHIDSNTIERKQEVLQGDHCDYYLYPSRGQKISVHSEPDSVAAYLISPVSHNFANGSYYVNKADKYVIRLDYEGIEFQTSPIDYDVVVTIE